MNKNQFNSSSNKKSTIHRLHIANPFTIGDVVILPEEQAHYVTNVLRIPVGGLIHIFNNICGEYTARIQTISKKTCSLLLEKLIRSPSPLPDLSIAMSIIKQDKMIQAITMLTQLGITNIIPIIADRSQVKELNQERILRCIIESTEQCERLCLPTLHQTIELKQFLEQNDYTSYICARERNNNATSLQTSQLSDKISIIIGPEGGFSDKEMTLLDHNSNVHNISLGALILRSETAAVALASQIQLLRSYA